MSKAAKGKTKQSQKILKIGVVTSKFNSEITEKLQQGALFYLHRLGKQVIVHSSNVPGAVEIPLACKAYFESGYDGVVALGCVIRGETSHYDYVCSSVERGVTQLMLEYKKPIGFGVLTTENEDQALARAGGAMGNKGAEAAEVAVEMIKVLKEIKNNAK
jgi:6,7-dimethyl-8-ribityllumazine synthase